MAVKPKKRGRPQAKDALLNSNSIIDTAKKLIRENGKIPSIRMIAATLGTDPMALYHYFPNKAALLEAVTVSLVEGIYKPEGSDWQEDLYKLCESYLTLLQEHKGLLETMLKMISAEQKETAEPEGPAAVFISRFYQAVAPLHLSEKKQKHALDLLADYLHGYALAMECNPALSTERLRGPFLLYTKALTS